MDTRHRQLPSITILHWNINSYNRKLQAYVALHHVDIISLNELRTSGANCYLRNYDLHYTDRDDTRYGGVAVFMKKGLKHRRISPSTTLVSVTIQLEKTVRP